MVKTILWSKIWIIVVTFTVILGLGMTVTPVGAQNKEELVFQKGLGRIENGFIIIPGAVENKTAKWLEITIHVKLFAQDGKELAPNQDMEPATTVNYQVAPGALGAFQYINEIAKEQESTYDHYELSTEVQEVEGTSTGEFSNVKTENTAGGFIQVTGVFKSTGTNACSFPTAVAVAYDAQGMIYEVAEIGVQDASNNLVEELKAGETGKFDLMMESGDGTVKDVKVVGGCGI
jgi:hypothetical protein